MVFFSMIGGLLVTWATTLWKSGEVTETLQIVYYPFTYGVAFSCFVLALVFFVDLLKSFAGKEEES